MTPIYLGQYDSGSDEWHDKRATRVGGSEAAAILGLSPYESRFSLYHRKIGLAPRQPENTAMSWGKRLERVVIEKWLETHADSHMAIKENGSYLSATHPFMIANPDQMVTDVSGLRDEVLEVKTSPYGDAWGPTGSDIYPVGYLVQCLHYGHVMEADTIHLAVLISGYDYREYTIRMADHADDLKMIIDAETEFIDDLTNRRAPDIDGHSQTYEVVKKLHPAIDPEREVEMDADTATAYRLAVDTFKAAEEAKRLYAATIIDRMDGAKYATYQGERIARRQAKGDAAPHLVAVTRPAAKKGIAA